MDPSPPTAPDRRAIAGGACRAVAVLAVAVLVAIGVVGSWTAPAAAQAPTPDVGGSSADDGTAQPGTGSEQPEEDEGEQLTWSVRPTPDDADPDRPNFSYEVEAGETVRDSLRVRNFGRQELPLVVYASDAIITSNGALDLLPAGEAPVGVGAWVHVGSGLVTVPPGEYVDIPFVVTVPANAESGDHSGGIVTSLVSEGVGDDGQPVRLDRRLGSRMHVRVSGELRPELAVSDLTVSYEGRANPFGSGTVQVSYTVRNVGNVRLAAGQRVRVRGLAGLAGQEVELDDTPELLVGSTLSFEVEVPGVWPTFRTEATVELVPYPTREGDSFDVDDLAATSSTRVWSVPWSGLVGLVALVAVGLTLRWRSRHRLRREDARVKAAVDAALVGAGGAEPSGGRAAGPEGAGDGPGVEVPS